MDLYIIFFGIMLLINYFWYINNTNIFNAIFVVKLIIV